MWTLSGNHTIDGKADEQVPEGARKHGHSPTPGTVSVSCAPGITSAPVPCATAHFPKATVSNFNCNSLCIQRAGWMLLIDHM